MLKRKIKLIIDDKIVIISSVNFSENAFKNNRESGMVIQDSTLANDATQVFLSDWQDGEIPPSSNLNMLKVQSINYYWLLLGLVKELLKIQLWIQALKKEIKLF